MKNKKFFIIIACIAFFIVGSFVFMFSNKTITTKNIEMPEANSVSEEILYDMVIEQTFTNTVDDISELAVVFNKIYEEGDLNIVIELLSGNNVIMSSNIPVETIESQHRVFVYADTPITGYVGKKLTLKIYSVQSSDDNTGLELFYNSDSNGSFKLGDKKISGTICFSLTGSN